MKMGDYFEGRNILEKLLMEVKGNYGRIVKGKFTHSEGLLTPEALKFRCSPIGKHHT